MTSAWPLRTFVLLGLLLSFSESSSGEGRRHGNDGERSEESHLHRRRTLDKSKTLKYKQFGAEALATGGDQHAVFRPRGDYGCAFVVPDEKAAVAITDDDSSDGNIVAVEHLRMCRTGNRWSIVFRNLALGYCCKSKLVILPPKDDVLAPGVFSSGEHGPRWFDFSHAPDVPGFNSSSCTKDIIWAGERAFRMNHLEDPTKEIYNPALLQCIKNVPRMPGCEAAYFFPKDVDVCSASTPGGSDKSGDGNLVIHIRSGDIFKDAVLNYYGQPPLQFYELAIADKNWDRVDVVTAFNGEDELNPVVPVLQKRALEGAYGKEIHFHLNRTMEEDLRAMMCADALATARSTLSRMTTFHTTAKTIYGPIQCNDDFNEVGLIRRDVEVLGMDWKGQYSVYINWENTADQHKEMIEYSDIAGFKRCG